MMFWGIEISFYIHCLSQSPIRQMNVFSLGMATWQKGKFFLVRVYMPHNWVCAFFCSFSALQTGKRVGKVLHASLQSVLHKEESLGPKRQKVGFLG